MLRVRPNPVSTHQRVPEESGRSDGKGRREGERFKVFLRWWETREKTVN